VAAIHPNGQGERDPATPVAIFVSGEPKKKKKKIQSLEVAVIHPQQPGGGCNPPQQPGEERSGHPQWVFFSSVNKKKKSS
jgi:hypothetical protein